MTADVTSGLGLVFLSNHSALLLGTTYIIFFNEKKGESLETSISEGILWTQAFYRCINTTPPTLFSHDKYAGTDTTPRRHHVSFTSLPYVFQYQTRPLPTYPTHLHSTGSTRKAAPRSTAHCLTFCERFPCGQWQLLVMCLCFSSLTPSLLPVFCLL